MNADLHCHSVHSDGTLSPDALAARAKAAGVALWALTDHDQVGGLAEARAAASTAGLPFLTGTEISVSFAGTTVHVVGLGFDADDARLAAGLAATRAGRLERAREMAYALRRAGIDDAFEGALRHAGDPESISRTHFARHLVESGRAADTGEVFRRWLVEGKPGYVPHRWASLRDAVGWIVDAGGVAVVAHPARYRLTPNEEDALFVDFKAHGGRGVEVVTGAHSAAEAQRYGELANELDLLASRGSDFHSPDESRVDLGGLPPLADGLRSVWSALEDRIVRA